MRYEILVAHSKSSIEPIALLKLLAQTLVSNRRMFVAGPKFVLIVIQEPDVAQ